MSKKIDKEELRKRILYVGEPWEVTSNRYVSLVDKLLKGKVLSAIRAKCMDCCAYQEAEVRECKIKSCPLWPFRMATNPFRKRKTQEQKDRLIQNLNSQTEEEDDSDDDEC